VTPPVELERIDRALGDRYRVERPLGAGGMATVYLAADLRHERQVAIKLLRPELAAALGRERFLNEIRVTARLQHPHILQLLDSGEADGLLYYVMPFMEGESLRSRLERERQLPVADAVRIGRELAEAVDYAHRHGVIHRDIKPENILLHEGHAVLADFGIMQAVRNAGGERLTATGMTLGTPGYMSPEQAAGAHEVEERSDIYSLGCVLYEMLAGQPPHSAPTLQALMQRVVMDEPRPIAALRPSTPAGFAAVIHTALAKLPADRYSSAAAFADALRIESAAAQRLSGSAPAPAARPVRAVSIRTTAAVVGLALLAGPAAVTLLRPGPAERLPPSRLSLLVSQGDAGARVTVSRQLAIAHDGETIAYFARDPGGRLALVVQPLHAREPTTLAVLGPAAGWEDIHLSPDGRRVLFGRGTRLMQVPLGGGTPTAVRGAVGSPWLAWQPNGTLWYTQPASGDLYREGEDDGRVPIFRADAAGRIHVQQILSDGRTALVVLVPPGAYVGTLNALDLRNGNRRVLLETPLVEARYASGVLVYATPDNALEAIAMDARAKRVRGNAVRLADDVALSGTGIAHFAVAANGTVVYLPNEGRELVLVDRSGAARKLVEPRHNYHSPRFSPDGRRIAVDFASADGRDVWLLDLEQETLTRATFDRDARDPEWSPDGRLLLYATERGGALGIRAVRPGIETAADSIFASPELGWSGAWIPGTNDIITVMTDGARSNIVRLRDGGRGPPTPVVASPYDDAWPAVSRDGRWLAYVSTRSGRQEVYVRPLLGDDEQVQVSIDGGSEPVWAHSGRELFYRTLSGYLMAAEIAPAPELRIMRRTRLFAARDYELAQPHANYDVTPDGRTFVMVRRAPVMRLTVIQNLPELIRRPQP
jgi:eukaryotic-like serine/threonine-protein kinase